MVVGLGTDLVEIERIRRMIDRHGDHFTERCFTRAEREYACRHRDPAIRYSARWAAKEAVVKAVGTGFIEGMTFHDIEVVPLHTGEPTVVLCGRTAELAATRGITRLLLTMSHGRDYATATAIGLAEPGQRVPDLNNSEKSRA